MSINENKLGYICEDTYLNNNELSLLKSYDNKFKLINDLFDSNYTQLKYYDIILNNQNFNLRNNNFDINVIKNDIQSLKKQIQTIKLFFKIILLLFIFNLFLILKK